jgi:predicted nucleic-acid-binding protein
LAISYRYGKKELEQVLETLLRSRELIIERAKVVTQALRVFSVGRADFADYLIERCAHAAECQYTVTFDQKAARAAGIRLLQ